MDEAPVQKLRLRFFVEITIFRSCQSGEFSKGRHCFSHVIKYK